MAEFLRAPFTPGGGTLPGLPPVGGTGGTLPGGGGYIPPIGPSIPGTPLGGGICPPGTRCIGPSASGPFGVSLCLGTCAPYDAPNGGDGPFPDWSCPDGLVFGRDPITGKFSCIDPESGIGPPIDNGGTPQPQGPGPSCGCGNGSASCCLPSGRKGKLNKSRYYRFGDCRRGTSAGVVNPGTTCVTPRRTNYGNDKAAMRAARRLNGAARHYKKMLDAVDSVSKAKSYKSRRRK